MHANQTHPLQRSRIVEAKLTCEGRVLSRCATRVGIGFKVEVRGVGEDSMTLYSSTMLPTLDTQDPMCLPPKQQNLSHVIHVSGTIAKCGMLLISPAFKIRGGHTDILGIKSVVFMLLCFHEELFLIA